MSKPYALVTGASSGIGRDLAFSFAARGIPVVLVARRADALAALAAELRQKHSQEALVLPLDLEKPDSAQQLKAHLESKGIALGWLVNNAGLGWLGDFAEAPWDRQKAMLDLNITSLVAVTHACLPLLKSSPKKGGILNVASTAAFQPGPGMAVYYASKAFVLSFSQALSRELAQDGLAVTALCPGPTATEFQARASMGESKLFANSFLVSRSHDVAEAGVQGLLAHRRVVVPGWINRISSFFAQMLPSALVLRMAEAMNNAKPKT